MDEGGSVVVTASGTDPEGATLTYAWDLDNNDTFETSGKSVAFSALGIDGPASRTIKARVTDPGGLSVEDTTTVRFANVAPTATLIAPTSVDEGSDISLLLSDPSDPSGADTTAGFTYSFDCGSGYGPFGSYHSFSCSTTDNGSRVVKGKVRDKDGGVSEYTG